MTAQISAKMRCQIAENSTYLNLIIYTSFETLLISGMKSKAVKESEEIHKEVKPGLCSLIKLDDIEDVLEEAPEKLADSVILFCQVLIMKHIISTSSHYYETTS